MQVTKIVIRETHPDTLFFGERKLLNKNAAKGSNTAVMAK
jgi:hypothetical protein